MIFARADLCAFSLGDRLLAKVKGRERIASKDETDYGGFDENISYCKIHLNDLHLIAPDYIKSTNCSMK